VQAIILIQKIGNLWIIITNNPDAANGISFAFAVPAIAATKVPPVAYTAIFHETDGRRCERLFWRIRRMSVSQSEAASGNIAPDQRGPEDPHLHAQQIAFHHFIRPGESLSKNPIAILICLRAASALWEVTRPDHGVSYAAACCGSPASPELQTEAEDALMFVKPGP
jgi:hypothetical protein